VRAAADENPDLFWALRGGGGNFGVVTAFEFALHPVGPEVMAGLVIHPAERGRELLELYRDVMNAGTDGLSLALVYLTAPAEPEIPEALHGRPAVAIAGMYAGSLAEGEDALRAIREYGPPAADLFEPMPYAAFQSALDDPPGYRNWWTAEHLTDLHDGAIEAIAQRSEEMPAGPSQLFIVAWGGAVGRVAKDATPLGIRDARFVVHPFALWEDPADDAEVISWARAYRADLWPWATGGVYLNFVGDEGDTRVRAGFGSANHARLARVKAQWDPENVFRGNQNVRPAA
jgi:FAD/FMN-containing dehydrogenase